SDINRQSTADFTSIEKALKTAKEAELEEKREEAKAAALASFPSGGDLPVSNDDFHLIHGDFRTAEIPSVSWRQSRITTPRFDTVNLLFVTSHQQWHPMPLLVKQPELAESNGFIVMSHQRWHRMPSLVKQPELAESKPTSWGFASNGARCRCWCYLDGCGRW